MLTLGRSVPENGLDIRYEEDREMLSKTLEELPPELKREALDYIEFLTTKYRGRRGRKRPAFGWAGGLADMREELTAVELQHRASEWR